MKLILSISIFCIIFGTIYCEDATNEIPIGAFLKKYDPFVILPDFVFHLERIVPSILKSGSVELADMELRGLSSLVITMTPTKMKETEEMEIKVKGKNIVFVIDKFILDMEAIGFPGSVSLGFHDDYELTIVAKQSKRIIVSSVKFSMDKFKVIISGVGENVSNEVTFLIQMAYRFVIKKIEVQLISVVLNLILYFVNNAS